MVKIRQTKYSFLFRRWENKYRMRYLFGNEVLYLWFINNAPTFSHHKSYWYLTCLLIRKPANPSNETLNCCSEKNQYSLKKMIMKQKNKGNRWWLTEPQLHQLYPDGIEAGVLVLLGQSKAVQTWAHETWLLILHWYDQTDNKSNNI